MNQSLSLSFREQSRYPTSGAPTPLSLARNFGDLVSRSWKITLLVETASGEKRNYDRTVVARDTTLKRSGAISAEPAAKRSVHRVYCCCVFTGANLDHWRKRFRDFYKASRETSSDGGRNELSPSQRPKDVFVLITGSSPHIPPPPLFLYFTERKRDQVLRSACWFYG